MASIEIAEYLCLYIDAAWVKPEGGSVIEAIDSANEKTFTVVPWGETRDLDRAVAAARLAVRMWSATSKGDRARLLRKAGEIMETRTEGLAEVLTRESGMPTKNSGAYQVGLPLGHFATAVAVLDEYEFEEHLGNSLIVREPVGVLACITPWDFQRSASSLASDLSADAIWIANLSVNDTSSECAGCR